MTDLTRAVLRAIVACSDQREPDLENNAHKRLIRTYPELSAETFASQLEALLTAGYLTHARAKRDSAGEVVRDRYLIPTTRGRVEVRR